MRGQIIEKSKIEKNNSVWFVRVQTRDSKGNLKSRSATVRGNRTDANKKLTEPLSEKDKGIITSPNQTLDEFLDTWLSIVKPRLQSRTYQYYSELLTRYVRKSLGKKKLKSIKAIHLQSLYADMQNEKNFRRMSFDTSTRS